MSQPRRRPRLSRVALATATFATAAFWTFLPSADTASAASANLLADAGGEDASCTTSGFDGMTVPGWKATAGSPNVVCFQNYEGFPGASTTGARPGKGYFAGGGFDNSQLTQTVDVSSAASAIDGGSTTYNLSAWLGGWSSQNDRAGVTATFLGAGGSSLGSASLGPVTATDRGLATKFLQRSATGAVPSGTRSIKVQINFTRTSGETTDGYADDLSLTLSAPVDAAALTVPASTVPGYDHVFFLFFENRDYGEIMGSSQAPYLNSLAQQGSLLDDYRAVTHVSDPNYIAVWGGSTFGRRTNPYAVWDQKGINAPHLGTRADSAGKTWKAYAEGMNGNCQLHDSDPFYWNDTPIPYFTDVQPTEFQVTDRCKAHDQPMTAMTSDLQSASTTPNLVWFAPDICSMMHDCGIKSGDDWAKATFPKIFDSPAWKNERSLLIVTFDEDGNGSGMPGSFGSPGQNNRVATLVLGSQNTVKAGYHSAARYDHYSSTRTMEQALGLSPLTSNDKYATPFNDVFTGN